MDRTRSFIGALRTSIALVLVLVPIAAAGAPPRGVWRQEGLPSSQPHAILVDRSDPTHWLIGTSRGLYRSRNSGNDWTVVLATGTGCGSLVQDPADPSSFFAGCGGVTSMGHGQAGLYHSADRGATWSRVGPRGDTSRIVVGSTTKELLSFRNGWLSRSLDGGLTWTPIGPPEQVNAFSAPTGTIHTILAAVFPVGVKKTTDGGATWSWATTGLNGLYGSRSIVIDPDDPNVAYVGTNGLGVFRSADGGMTWSHLGVSGSVVDLFIDDARPRRLWSTYTTGELLQRDAAGTWKVVLTPGPVPGFSRALAMGFDRTDDRHLLVGADGGAGLLVSENGGTTWGQRNKGVSNYWVTDVVPDPRRVNSPVVLGTMQQRSLDGGTTWVPLGPCGDSSGMFLQVVFDPNVRDTLYGTVDFPLETQAIFCRSTDGGVTWSVLSWKGPDRFVIEPTTGWFFGVRLSSQANVEVIFSSDGGRSWTVKSELPGYSAYLGFTSAGTLLLSYSPKLNDYPVLSRSLDKGVTWTQTYKAAWQMGAEPVWQEPGARGRLFLKTTYALLTSTDDGLTWRKFPCTMLSRYFRAPPFQPCSVQPFDQVAYHVASGTRFRTTSGDGVQSSGEALTLWTQLGGATWPLGEPWPGEDLTAVAVDQQSGRVWVGTAGRGVWAYDAGSRRRAARQ